MNLHFIFSVREVSEINDGKRTFTMPMYLALEWEEVRLNINENHKSWDADTTGPKDENTEEIETLMMYLWKPNLEIYGLEHVQTHQVLGDMAGLRVSKNKTIKYDSKVTFEVSCPMEFTSYPFDQHICSFQLGSYFYDQNSMTCTSQLFGPNNSDFKVRNLQHEVTFHDLRFDKSTVALRTGIYSACGFEVVLKRKYEPFLFEVYIPCMLFVIVSWISFIIDPQLVPGRMSLLIILFLVIINTFNSVKENAPSSSSNSLNSIESYSIFCIFCIFSAIIEYAIILTILALRTQPKHLDSLNKMMFNQEKETKENIEIKPKKWGKLVFVVEKPRCLDTASILILPIIFFIYNIYYWFFEEHKADY